MRMKTDEVVEKWVKINYDYGPKYCQTCMIQGHDEEQCYVVHPDLHPNRDKSEYDEGKKVEGKHNKNTNKDNDIKRKQSEQHHGRKEDEFVHNEELLLKNGEEGSSYMARRDSVTTPRLFETSIGEIRVNQGEDAVISKGPDLIDEDEEVMQQRKDTEEDEGIKFNKQEISKAGDLSPRHTNSLKNGARKGRPFIPITSTNKEQ
ncbi:hypothetical protein H5410_026708 [Solanum commersonii]|uniref:Uncharacterized protein n=1 Tax=Solanum commersonii TaxID=4109 RepID=A0A9J5YZL8_SOLCO|nr:hypothetical protein H5410_026708 [Solanum commersonii]